MLKLYHLPISFNSRRVWVAMLEKGLEFELIPMKLDGDQFKPEFLALNPFHHIPVLVDGDFTIIESLAILDYLEAKYPTPSLLPQEPQALGIVRMVEAVTLNELLPQMRPLISQQMGLAEPEAETLAQSKQKIATVLTFFGNLLGERAYFINNSLTLADIVAGTVVPLLPALGFSLQDYPQLKTWCKRLKERESWQQTQAKPEEIEAFKSTMQKLFQKQN